MTEIPTIEGKRRFYSESESIQFQQALLDSGRYFLGTNQQPRPNAYGVQWLEYTIHWTTRPQVFKYYTAGCGRIKEFGVDTRSIAAKKNRVQMKEELLPTTTAAYEIAIKQWPNMFKHGGKYYNDRRQGWTVLAGEVAKRKASFFASHVIEQVREIAKENALFLDRNEIQKILKYQRKVIWRKTK